MKLEELTGGYLDNYLLRLKYDGLMPKEKNELSNLIKIFVSGGFERIVYSEWVWDKNAVGPGFGAWVCKRCRKRNENIHAMKYGDPYFWPGSGICPHCGARFRKPEEDTAEVSVRKKKNT